MANTQEESSSENTKSCDYMSIGYDLIKEPLNLREKGRAWFKSVYLNNVNATSNHNALLLGSVDWMIAMLAQNSDKVSVIDGNPAMIKNAQQRCGVDPGKVDFISGNWMDLPPLPAKVDAVLGDNSFNFLAFPDSWEQVCASLSAMMNVGAVVFFRFFSVPSSHTFLSPAEIVAKYRSTQEVNYTAVRTDILFSQWEPDIWQLSTERALACYEENRDVFATLLEGKPPGFQNDLETIAKYRNTGSVYHIPPLAEILQVIEKSFHIRQVNFGPYEFSQYFPLVVATKAR